MHRYFWLILLAASWAPSGCALRSVAVVVDTPPPGTEGVIFAADGAGDFRFSSMQLRKTIRRQRAPLQVVTFVWSHGMRRIVADQTDYVNIRYQGKRLADEVLRFRHENPRTSVYLWGHSAGSAVVLACLENLPPGIVEQAFLLAPTASTHYDMRPALQSVNQAIHVFYSFHDWMYAGVATRILGTTDRQHSATAARFGFCELLECEEDRLLYAKLVQRPWQPSDRLIGNQGGHFGAYQTGFIRHAILPLILHDAIPLVLPDPSEPMQENAVIH